MTFPKPPELASTWDCMDDAAFANDAEASAQSLRNLMRSGNLAKARGDLMCRYLASMVPSVALDAPIPKGVAIGFGWPFWHLLVPLLDFPVPKKPGLTRMRAAVRALISTSRDIELQVASAQSGMTGGFWDNPPNTKILGMTGTGALVRYTKNDFEVRGDGGETLAFYARGVVDPDTDPLLDTTTFGGASSGTCGFIWPAGFMFDGSISGTPWHTTGTNQLHLAGHYIVFTAPADGRVIWGPCAILDVARGGAAAAGTGLFFWPIPDSMGLPITAHYEIHTLPAWRLASLAAYSVDAEP